MKTYRSFKQGILKDKEMKRAYEKLGPEFDLIRMLIKKRFEKGFTQKELARRVGTRQSAISRLESGRYNPTLGALRKIAGALDADLKVLIR